MILLVLCRDVIFNSFSNCKLLRSISLCSVLVNEHAVVVWGHSPVLRGIVFVGVVLLVIREEVVQLQALSKVFGTFEASNVLQKVEVSVNIDAGADESMPVNALELHVSVVLLEFEVNRFSEIDIWPLDRVHVFTSHFELIEVVVLREDLHIYFLMII